MALLGANFPVEKRDPLQGGTAAQLVSGYKIKMIRSCGLMFRHPARPGQEHLRKPFRE